VTVVQIVGAFIASAAIVWCSPMRVSKREKSTVQALDRQIGASVCARTLIP